MTRTDSAYANAGFPFKLGEFLASGKPVIASNVSDVGKFFTDRHDTMLVKPGECKEIDNKTWPVTVLMNNGLPEIKG